MIRQAEIENDPLFNLAIRSVFLLVAGLVLPALLIFVIRFTGYSEIIEEIGKTLVVLFLILKFSTVKQKIMAGIAFGFFFGLSENIFYLNQIFQFGDLSVFGQRFLWPLPMHIATVLIILFSALAGKKYIFFGLIGAIIAHFIFNIFLAG